jgi:hypothetical protein
MIRLAKEMRDATRRGEDLGLNDGEIAFLRESRGMSRTEATKQVAKITKELGMV